MEKGKLSPIQPRSLRYRNHYKIYVLGFVLLTTLVLTFWGLRFYFDGLKAVFHDYSWELGITGLYFLFNGVFYFTWLRSRLRMSVQAFEDHILVHKGRVTETITYADIESLNVVGWSIFYVKMKSGHKHYFNSSLERVDYIWEGIYKFRPEIISQEAYENFRVKLVQYDHHQKRKEWFFKHKLVDALNWFVLPAMFVSLAYIFQSKQVIIHQEGLYFFRLVMYSLLVLLSTSFLYTFILKKLVFDKKVSSQMEESQGAKVRDLEFEGVVLQRSKIFQLVTAMLVLGVLAKLDVNLYSVSKVREDIASFNLKKGHTILIDNRYNCTACKHQVNDGDLVVFGRGVIGQVLAKEGDFVGEVSQDTTGRTVASQNVQEVPRGHLAVKLGDSKDIIFIQIEELIGKIQN